ncbi:hypothetical protein D8Y22_00135 [Salinadaptatus halalkaliphilus]|uniref:HNH endonuclease n=1 Tax=Salinadaptatus halalkaliphilus TaxID=2419781 RepID=A0A4S3TR18_9EURY|nr:hypothetical protein [Salinadaptatus halalkaliphilus]THE66854.1 hypothetical protein D8Y22_00135 [Salinadaptatus halalkaliphilus]
MTTEGECLEALQRAADELGESPTKAQYEELGLTPASATIIRTCGGWNDAKEKAGLETAYSRGSRVGPKPDDVELPAGTSWDELTVDQRWHYRNVEWNTERTLRRRSRLRCWLYDQKSGEACSRCGTDTVACLDFHHVEDEEKLLAVGRMVTYGYGTEAIRTEIEKCEILCANCHRKTHRSPPESELRRWVYGRKRDAGGCDRCSESDPSCLDFHHTTDEKDATIAELTANNKSKQRIRSEMERCTVPCANCHRAEHYTAPTN